ncbi:DNA polymerase III subunit delta [Paenisporosarcina cavernae]|uniref:DNA polymerase III subunit delta n=1 Tax=Paenisporosarcina cavernae TaxID=2320858 RepID=A0A385YVZ6_9BACL|nr:DNA polymerase III subunit delta [Paenisporosarcina cavernae]AYC29682.1 DNA polymerase III subunit delta [Paenisporosarcina cavernae]
MLSKEWKQIEAGNISPVYLLIGTEQYLIDETIHRLEKALQLQDGEEKTIFDLQETPVEALVEESNTVPFFADKKLIIGKNATFLKASDKTKEKVSHQLDYLDEWLDNPSPTSITVFVAPYEKLDERKKVTKKMKQTANVLEVKPLQSNDVSVWIKNEVGKHGKAIEDEAIQVLVETLGTNLLQLSGEIEKLSTFLGEEKTITALIVENLLTRTLEQDVFQLLNAYFKGNKTKAIQIYHDLLRQKEEPIMINALLASQVRLQLNVLYLQNKGYPVTQIAKQLKVNPYRVKLIVESKPQMSEKKLLVAMNRLADNDLELKTSSLKRERILELFLLKD